jgi:hypothetical protein
MSAWSEEVIDAEDMHRRCAAHHEFVANNPDVMAFAEDWADRNLDDLAQRWPPRGNIWTLDTDAPTTALVISATAYYEMSAELTVMANPIFAGTPIPGWVWCEAEIIGLQQAS